MRLTLRDLSAAHEQAYVIWLAYVICQPYAILRSDAGLLRFAIKVARRVPRVQGKTVWSFAAVSTTDLIKRVLVFIGLSLS